MANTLYYRKESPFFYPDRIYVNSVKPARYIVIPTCPSCGYNKCRCIAVPCIVNTMTGPVQVFIKVHNKANNQQPNNITTQNNNETPSQTPLTTKITTVNTSQTAGTLKTEHAGKDKPDDKKEKYTATGPDQFQNVYFSPY